MPKKQLWAKIKSSPSAFAANMNAPQHRSSRSAPAGDAGYTSGNSSKSKSNSKMKY